MSAEKWESPTWDWIEREIVDHILIASKKLDKAKTFLNRLANRREPASRSRRPAAPHQRSTSNG
ncbi:MAG TPA: hypothetical protein VGX94_00845 [Terriglobia bacterium]|nr:hypothetical protein [Terriglobia bacterium]